MRKRKFINNKLHINNKGQVITLMGAILSLSVVLIAVISTQLSTIGGYVPSQKSVSLLPEFINVKDTFIYAVDKLTYDISSNTSIINAFNTTKNLIYRMEIQRGLIFDAVLNKIYYRDPNAPLRYISVTLRLTDGHAEIVKTLDIPLQEKIGGIV